MTSLRIFLLATLGSIAIVVATYFWMFGSGKNDWIIGGGEKGGNYDEAAQAIAESLKKTMGWKVSTAETTGSGDNLKQLRPGKIDLCLLQQQVLQLHNHRSQFF